MIQSIERVDHTIPKEEAVFAFGAEMKPVLEVSPGEVVTFETHDCISGQIQTENDLVTDIDFSKVNPATGPSPSVARNPATASWSRSWTSGPVPKESQPSFRATASS
jgi:hypothetical protein